METSLWKKYCSVLGHCIKNQFIFCRYGPAVIMYYNLPPEERSLTHGYNPMCEAFPRIASCDYVRYGTGGAQENRSAICILGLNMINDKVSKLH